jgi:hypothetical protein
MTSWPSSSFAFPLCWCDDVPLPIESDHKLRRNAIYKLVFAKRTGEVKAALFCQSLGSMKDAPRSVSLDELCRRSRTGRVTLRPKVRVGWHIACHAAIVPGAHRLASPYTDVQETVA